MKAIATLSLLGVALTHEDNELSVLSKLFHHKKHPQQQQNQPTHVPESLGEDFIIHPDFSNEMQDYEFSILSKLIHPKKKHPQQQTQPQQPTPGQQPVNEEYIVHPYVEDNELSLFSKLFHKKKHPQQQPQQPTPVTQPAGEDFINYPGLTDSDIAFDDEFSFLSKLIHPKKKHPQPQPQPQQPTPVQKPVNEEYIVHPYVPDNEFSILSKIFHKKKHPQPQPQPQQPTPVPQPTREEYIVHPYVPDNEFMRVNHPRANTLSQPKPHLPKTPFGFDDDEFMSLPPRSQPTWFPKPSPTFPERPIHFEDDELMTLPYRPQPTWFPKPSPTFPGPFLPEEDFPIRKPHIYFDDNEFNAVVEQQAVEDEVTLEAFLIECFGPAVGLNEERDQLVQEVLDVVRDVLTPDEVDEETLVQATEEFVDESLEINSYFKNHAN